MLERSLSVSPGKPERECVTVRERVCVCVCVCDAQRPGVCSGLFLKLGHELCHRVVHGACPQHI